MAWFNGRVHSLALFAALALVVTFTPGPATALVVRSALRGGSQAALRATLGNSLGVLGWGAASALGVAALVQASALAFLVLKLTGAAVLVWLGLQSLRRNDEAGARPRRDGHPFREGLVSACANPKLALFFVALFPQFLDRRGSTLAAGLLMASLVVALDLVWFSSLAFVIGRLRRALLDGRWQRRAEALSGSVMVGLGIRLALEAR